MMRYVVRPEDTLYSIASRFRIPLDSLLQANPYCSPWNMRPGMPVLIPDSAYRNAVYDILGSSDKISKAEMNNIIEGRKYIVRLAKKYPDEIYVNGPAGEKNVSLTFDDGPDGSVTPRILDILKDNKIKVSFFFVGTQINYFPGMVRRAYDEGHLVLNHTWDHPYLTKKDAGEIRREITLTENRIQSITGRKPALVRPPYGAADEKVIAAISGTNNRAIMWSIDSMDWVPKADKQTILKNILDNVRPGDIVLLHSSVGHGTDAEALQELINGLKGKGYKIVDLEAMLKIKPYKPFNA